jgi:hypothetical protein
MFCGDGANSRIEIVDPIGQCRRVWARGSPRKMKVESGRTDRRLSGGLSDGAGCAVDVGCLLPSPHSIVIVNNMQHVRINIVSSPRYRSEGRPPNAWGRGCTLIERRVARSVRFSLSDVPRVPPSLRSGARALDPPFYPAPRGPFLQVYLSPPHPTTTHRMRVAPRRDPHPLTPHSSRPS